MQFRAGKLSSCTTFSTHSDGASVYTLSPQWLALRVLHDVDQRYPWCTHPSQSVAGAGKFGCDRAHAEFNAQAERQLRQGKDQTNARQHAEALVADGGVKGTMVSVVEVPRNADTDQFLNLSIVDHGHIPVEGEAPPVAVSQADKDFDPNNLSLVEWLTQRGTFHTTLLHPHGPGFY